MTDTKISASEAELLLHKLVTEGLPVISYFTDADGSRTAKLPGFVQSFTKAHGLVVGTESPLSQPEKLSAWMHFSHEEVAAADFIYQDETTVPEGRGQGSALRIHFSNGDSLIIIEIKDLEKRNESSSR
jgi:hypothetical protein